MDLTKQVLMLYFWTSQIQKIILNMVRNAIKPGGFFGCLLPTTNQVSRLLEALKTFNFSFIEVCEIIQRYYKPVPARLRPDDRLTAHTGFLIFGRPMLYTGKGASLNVLPDVNKS